MSRTAVATPVPVFSLYGEDAAPLREAPVHIELIETRSRLHDWHIARHTHRGLFQVLFLTAGQVTAYLNDAVYACTGPVAVTISPSAEHGFDFSPQAQGFVLTLDQQVVFAGSDCRGGAEPAADLLAALFQQPIVIDLHAAEEICARLSSLCGHMMTETSWALVGQAEILQWLARSSLLLLVRVQADQHFAGPQARSDFAVFGRFRQLVELHHAQQLPIGWYAAQLRMRTGRLNRLCLQIAGTTGFALTQARVLQAARRELRYSTAGVAEIAYALGFQDPAYFSRLFKRHTGVTPKQFRQQADRNGAGMPA